MVAFLERRQRGVDGRRDGRAALRNRIHVPAPARFAERPCCQSSADIPEMRRPRTPPAQAGPASPAASIPARRAWRVPAGPARCPRQHAFGGVNRHHDVQAALFDPLQIKSVLRPRQRDDQQRHGQNQASGPDFPARRRNPDRQRRQQPRFNELRQQFLPPRDAHQKNSTSAGGKTSSSQRNVDSRIASSNRKS